MGFFGGLGQVFSEYSKPLAIRINCGGGVIRIKEAKIALKDKNKLEKTDKLKI
jgi:hypothetical protein